MFTKVRNFLIAGAAAATAAMADNSVAWWPASVDKTAFDGTLETVAPIAIAVVIGVAGVRVAIKLINRGAGK